MFCPKCGAQAPDGAVCCPNCGTNLNNAEQAGAANQNAGAQEMNDNGGAGAYDYIAASQTVEPTEAKKSFNPIIIVVAAVAVIFVLLILRVLFAGSYKDPVKDYVKLLNKQSHDYMSYQDLSQTKSQMKYAEQYSKIMDEEFDYYEDEWKELFDDWEDEYGSNFKVRVEFDDVQKIDKDDLKDMQKEFRELYEDKEDIEEAVEELEDSLSYYVDNDDISKGDRKKLVSQYEKLLKDYKKTKVQKGYEADLVFTIKGKEGDDKYRMKNIAIYKINGKWLVESGLEPDDLYFDY